VFDLALKASAQDKIKTLYFFRLFLHFNYYHLIFDLIILSSIPPFEYPVEFASSCADVVEDIDS
jgi:hypothetical protein